MREIEIKLKVDNLEELEQKLKDTGLVFSKEIKQHDTVYAHKSDPDILSHVKKGDIFIRIRTVNGVSELTLKQQRGIGLDKIEHETKVENREEIHNILSMLGWI